MWKLAEHNTMNKQDDDEIGESVCVICGTPWISIANVCKTCGGLCSWGAEKGAEPSSWTKTDKGYVPKPPKIL